MNEHAITETNTSLCAPAERATDDEVRAARRVLLANKIAIALLEAMPELVVILNPARQIIMANQPFLAAMGGVDAEEFIGLRPGEAVGCSHCHDTPGGCGAGQYCLHCGAVDAITECLRTRTLVSRECRILTRNSVGALDLEVQATFLCLDGVDLIVLVMRDISAAKRRQVLEQIFFHDVLNTASSLRMAASLLREPDVLIHQQCLDITSHLTDQLIDEISAQQCLLAAEQGEYTPTLAEVEVADLLGQVRDAYAQWKRPYPIAVSVRALPACRITTDIVVMRRVLGNLVKNALEALTGAGTVTLAAESRATSLLISVHNPGVIPREVQRQIFQRSFSTKATKGRGIGTYSVKLFVERYLGGTVSFTSRESAGTTFVVSQPPVSVGG